MLVWIYGCLSHHHHRKHSRCQRPVTLLFLLLSLFLMCPSWCSPRAKVTHFSHFSLSHFLFLFFVFFFFVHRYSPQPNPRELLKAHFISNFYFFDFSINLCSFSSAYAICQLHSHSFTCFHFKKEKKIYGLLFQ